MRGIRKINLKKAVKNIKNMPGDKAKETSDQITAAARGRVIKQMLDQKPEWTYEDAVRECQRTDPDRDPEVTMWWKIAPFVTIMQKDKDKLKVREILDDDEKEVFDRKIMPLDVKKQVREGVKRRLKEL